ncbi:transposase [Nocardiopsis sp. CNS-639]|uniref:transposase n=1 Tax=Nocardiopsis sp. CNS-639 TaxID=1169153 RepID=UPI00351087FF
MRWAIASRAWLEVEYLPAYAPEINPVEMLWSAIKTRELANVAGGHLAHVADAAERGINRVCATLPGPSLLIPGWRSTLQPHTTNEKLSKEKNPAVDRHPDASPQFQWANGVP